MSYNKLLLVVSVFCCNKKFHLLLPWVSGILAIEAIRLYPAKRPRRFRDETGNFSIALPHLRNKKFLQKFLSQKNASKFAIFYIEENPHFSFRATLYFYLMNALPGLCQHRPGHSLGEKLKYHERKKERKTVWVFVFQKYGKL